MTVMKVEVKFNQRKKPFKGFISTWETHRQFDKQSFKNVLAEFKKVPILLNIQYIKVKYRTANAISVSFKTEEDEAAFLLLTSAGHSGVEIEVDDEWYSYW